MAVTRGPGARRLRVIRIAAATLALVSLLPAFAAESYVRATVDGDGQLRILTANGETIEPKMDGKQVGFAKPRIALDGSAVGWLAEYPNCCTSYPIPLKLFIQTNNTVITLTGNGVPIWSWEFQMGGRHVAFGQETVHGGFSVHYELRDVASGGLLAEFRPEVGPDNQELPTQDAPAWVDDLIAGP